MAESRLEHRDFMYWLMGVISTCGYDREYEDAICNKIEQIVEIIEEDIMANRDQ